MARVAPLIRRLLSGPFYMVQGEITAIRDRMFVVNRWK